MYLPLCRNRFPCWCKPLPSLYYQKAWEWGRRNKIMDFTFKEFLAITLVRNDKKITTIQDVKYQQIVSIKDLHAKLNIRLTYILVSYSLCLGKIYIVWLSLFLGPIDSIRWVCACIIILSYDYEVRIYREENAKTCNFICVLVASAEDKCCENPQITPNYWYQGSWAI